MKRKKSLQKSFGLNEFGLVDMPRKISGTKISRLLVGDLMGCSYCFPHGIETLNSHWNNNQRSWKKYRKTRRRIN